MTRAIFAPISVSLLIVLSTLASGQAKSGPAPAPPAPFFRITFERGEPVAGVTATGAVAVPFECTSDGTAFVNMLHPFSPETQSALSSHFSKYSEPLELVSVPPSGEAHEFRLDQITDLYDIRLKAYYASESGVLFLVIAASEDKQGKQEFVSSDGAKHEIAANLAEHHDYLVAFDRKGDYKETIQLDDTLAIQKVAAFPSGMLLSFGFDRQDRTPKLFMLKDDGSLLKFLEIPRGAAPTSVFRTQFDNGEGPAVFVKPVQLLPRGDTILVVQNKSKFPVLEVNEAGAVREIKPKLPEGMQINSLIPSDGNLYAQIDGFKNGLIYELNPQDGSVVRRLEVANNAIPAEPVACVHDGKFLAFYHGEGKLIPLVGTAQPAPEAGAANTSFGSTTKNQ